MVLFVSVEKGQPEPQSSASDVDCRLHFHRDGCI